MACLERGLGVSKRLARTMEMPGRSRRSCHSTWKSHPFCDSTVNAVNTASVRVLRIHVTGLFGARGGDECGYRVSAHRLACRWASSRFELLGLLA